MTLGKVSGIVLAAGPSTRLRQHDTPKQLLPFAGKTLVRRAAETALRSRLVEVIVVLGYAFPQVREALSGLPLALVVNPDHVTGQSSSVREGLAAVDADSSGALFLPCDQPLISAGVLDLLVSAHESAPETVVLPTFESRRGAPVLFPRSLFHRLAALTGDAGGRQLLPGLADRIVEVPLHSEKPLRDVDTWEEYQALAALHSPSEIQPEK